MPEESLDVVRLAGRRSFLVGLSGAIAAILVVPARAGYPDRAIKIIVPGSAGGPTDVMARLISQRLQQTLGQTVVVEKPRRGRRIGCCQGRGQR